MATHSSVLAWRSSGTEEPGGLPSMGSHRVRHDWSDFAAAAVTMYIAHFAYLLIPWWAHGSISCFSNVIMGLWTWSANNSSKSYFQFFRVYPNIELLDHVVTQFLIFWVIAKLFPQWLYHIVLPPTVQKDYNFFTFLTTLVAFVFWLLFQCVWGSISF